MGKLHLKHACNCAYICIISSKYSEFYAIHFYTHYFLLVPFFSLFSFRVTLLGIQQKRVDIKGKSNSPLDVENPSYSILWIGETHTHTNRPHISQNGNAIEIILLLGRRRRRQRRQRLPIRMKSMASFNDPFYCYITEKEILIFVFDACELEVSCVRLFEISYTFFAIRIYFLFWLLLLLLLHCCCSFELEIRIVIVLHMISVIQINTT